MLALIGRTSTRRLAPTLHSALYQSEPLRLFAAEAAKAGTEDDDIVLSAFRKHQKQYQAFIQGLQNINLPLTGDDAAIKKYAQEVEALKKKVGMPDFEDIINAELDYKFACSGYDVRKFVTSALEGMKLGGNLDAAVQEVMSAVDEAEKSSGRSLDAGNDKGWTALTAKMGEIEKKYGMQDKTKVRDEAIFDTYKKHIGELRSQVEDDVGKVRAAEDLEHIKPDLGKIKPKLV